MKEESFCVLQLPFETPMLLLKNQKTEHRMTKKSEEARHSMSMFRMLVTMGT